MVLTKNRCYSIFIFFLVNLSIFYPQKLLANVNNPEQKQNNRISTQIDVLNQEQTPFDSWLKIIQQNKDQLSQHELALIKSKVASAFFQVGNYQEAIEYWRWANKVYRTNQQNRLLANNLSNLARAYLSLGETLLAEKKINEVMKIAQEEQLKDVLFSGYLTLGNIAKLTGKYLEAETNFNKSFEYARRIEEKIAVNLNLSQVFNAQAERLLKRTQAISAEDLELESTEQQIISYQHKAWAAANRAVKPSENLESLIAVDALLQAIQLKVTTSKKINISQSELEKSIGQWRYSLEDRSEANYWSLSQQMYALLLEPIKSELSSLQPDTLIFVNDGLLRNVPMAALHDGQNFLIQDYALSFSLSLNLRVREEKTSIHNTQILAFALSEETDIFSALPYVQEEIDSINELVKVQRFFNTEFVISKVEKELVENDYGIVHFATHAKFNGTLEDSFLKTYQEQISLTDLENMLNLHQLNFPEKPLELLTLSACETAASNKSATLGMAGVAIRSGVRNAVGSLWSISDRGSVNIITEFYRGLLSQELPPNEALRQAQIKMISDNPYFHPAVWSNLILIDS